MKRTIITFLLLGVFLQLSAKVNTKVEEAVKGSFPKVDLIEPKQLILDKTIFKKIQQEARAKVETKIYRYYSLLRGNKTVGYGILIARKVRTKKATVLYAFDNTGKLKFAEIMGFKEPPEFIPNNTWMGQFKEKPGSAPLQMGKDIPTISGATLSARNISDGARIARAIFKYAIK
ncbi:FMN-binding protein [Sulfurovum sp. ST-21]|uniref:FMN-binding domain-containing protein n=1 Tax=Sulfurovum indicum TaxID=2779528 RepID=A0A7M1S5S4_9BACT|nr:FMN-binding protein [Sulfurovum indicum]QOR62422.1 hypothetical protein IMZ28_02800 [Sulfurovum indicum]